MKEQVLENLMKAKKKLDKVYVRLLYRIYVLEFADDDKMEEILEYIDKARKELEKLINKEKKQ